MNDESLSVVFRDKFGIVAEETRRQRKINQMNKLGANLLFVTFFLFTLISMSCTNSSENGKSEIFLDVLAITNYRNKSFTIDSLAKIAKKYIDTVKAPLPVAGVTFIGQKPEGHLPSSKGDNYDEQVKCYLLNFRFSNAILDTTTNNKNVELRGISVWYDQERIPKIQLDKMLNAVDAFKIDSMLHSNVLFDNGF